MTKVRVSDAEHNFLVVVNGCIKVRKILRGFAREGVEVIVTYHLVYIGWKDFLCPSVKTKPETDKETCNKPYTTECEL